MGTGMGGGTVNPASYYGTSNFWPNGYFYGPTATPTTDPTGQFVGGYTGQTGVPFAGQPWNGYPGFVPTGFNQPGFFNPYAGFNGVGGFNGFTPGFANSVGSFGQPFGYTQGQGYSPFNGPFVPQNFVPQNHGYQNGYQNCGYPTTNFQSGFQSGGYPTGFNTTPWFNNGFAPVNTGYNTPFNTPFNGTPWGFNNGWNTQGLYGQPTFNQGGFTQPTFQNQFVPAGFNPFIAAWQNGFNGFGFNGTGFGSTGFNGQTNTQFVNQQQAEANFRRNIGLCRDAA